MVMTTLGARLAPPKMTPRQYGYLSLLVFYTSSMTFLMHKSRIAYPVLPNRGLYSIPVSIFLAELLKLAASLAVEHYNRQHSTQYRVIDEQSDTEMEGGIKDQESVTSSAAQEKAHMRGKSLDVAGSSSNNSSSSSVVDTTTPLPPSSSTANSQDAPRSLVNDVLAPDCWKLSVPAALYVAQNLLQMVAISSVSAVTYQAVTQCKLLATTLLSVWLLSRLYSYQQWCSIFILLIGVIIVSVSKIKEGSAKSRNADAVVAAKLFGVIAVLAACTLGSGAAVYMEKVLKSDVKTSLWIRNAQLSLFSLIPAGMAVLYEAYKQGAWHPLQWFGTWAWLTVVARSIGGFLIALILKQCDALVKGIATSIAMVLSIFIESLLYDVPVSSTFAFGALLVVASSCVYVRYGVKA